MIIPDKPLYIEKRELKVIQDILIPKLKKQDIWIILVGKTGTGKTSKATHLMYYFQLLANRKLSIENYYFDADQLRNKAQASDSGMFDWDEAAIGGLSQQWFNKSQVYLMQYAMTSRIKHHIILVTIPDLRKLNSYFIERANVLIRTYLKKGRHGRFMWYSTKNLTKLYEDYKKTKTLKWGTYKSFGGYFPDAFEQLFTEQEKDDYYKRKISMIESIGKNPKANENEHKKEVMELKYKISKVKFPINSQQEYANQLGIGKSTLTFWSRLANKEMYTPSKKGV